MQDKYSLAYAMAKDGQGVYGDTSGTKRAEIVNPGALLSGSLGDAALLSSMSVGLNQAGSQLNQLSVSLGGLRNSVDALKTAISRLNGVGINAVKTLEPMEQKSATEFESSTSQGLRLAREALAVRDMQRLDPVAAFQQSNASLTFDATATSETSITALRKASRDSEQRLSKTLEPAPLLLEETWLKTKTGVQDTANSWAGDSPLAAQAVKTTEAVISPMVSGLLSGLGETIKTRVAGNLVDVTLGKLPGVGKLFRDGGYTKDKDKDKACCCPAAASVSGFGVFDTVTAQLPESVGETVRERDKARTRGQPKKRRQKLPEPGQPVSRESTANVRRKPVEPQAQQAGPPLNAMGQPLVPLDTQRLAQSTSTLPGHSFGASATPPAARLGGRRATKGLAEGLSGVLAKLESAGARRLGPMRYVDTALSVADGVRNGDAKAIGAGLSTAGGAWAGASAGAALGTLVFPGVGTAVGGAIGGLLGSEVGTWFGDKLFGSGDRLPAPGAVGKDLNAARTDNVQVSIAPSIQITGVNPADAQQVVNQVIQALQFQCVPMVTDALGIRRNTAMTDPPGGD